MLLYKVASHFVWIQNCIKTSVFRKILLQDRSTRFYAVYINILPFSSPLLLSFVLSSCLSHSSCSSDTHCPSKSCLLLFFSGRTINANWRQLPHIKMTVSGLPCSGVLCHGREWKWCGKCDTSLEVGCCDHFLPPFLFLPMTQMRI